MSLLVLLLQAAMVLYGQDERQVRGEERVLEYGVLHDLPEGDLGRERPPVVDDGLTVVAVPAVD